MDGQECKYCPSTLFSLAVIYKRISDFSCVSEMNLNQHSGYRWKTITVLKLDYIFIHLFFQIVNIGPLVSVLPETFSFHVLENPEIQVT